MVFSACCFHVGPVCSLAVLVIPGGSKGRCIEVWGVSKILALITQGCMYVGDGTASQGVTSCTFPMPVEPNSLQMEGDSSLVSLSI